MDYPALRTELTTDPVALGYAPLTDQAAADRLNATTTGRTLPRANVPTTEVLGAIVNTEWPAAGSLSADKLARILAMPYVDASNTRIRALIGDIFAAGTGSRTNLLALGTVTVSRATELGLGAVAALDVNRARAGVW